MIGGLRQVLCLSYFSCTNLRMYLSTSMYSSPQVFQRVPAVTTLESEDDARFAYFRDVILSPLLVSYILYVHDFLF